MAQFNRCSHLHHSMLRRLVMAGLLVLAVLACGPAVATEPSAQERLAVGTWYGEYSAGAGQPVQRFINTRHPDGTYVLVARLYDKGKPTTELRNKGLWGISNGLYFTITTEVNGQRVDPAKADVAQPYLVQSLNSMSFEYAHVASGNRFRVTRVDPATARLPD